MTLFELIKKIPAETIREDKELKDAYLLLKEIFEPEKTPSGSTIQNNPYSGVAK